MKKQKLTIFLVAVLMMLTIYYIKMPDKTDNTNPVNNEQSDLKNEKILEARETYLEEKTLLMDELNTVIANKDKTLSEKKKALEKLEIMNKLFDTEMSLETAILSLGYDEALVKIDNTNGYNVYVTIVAETLSAEEFIEVAEVIKTNTASYYKVNIEFVK